MRPKSVTVTASAGGMSYSNAIVVDPVAMSVALEVTGSAIATVEHSFSDPFAINLNASANAGKWVSKPDMLGVEGNADAVYDVAPRAVRLALGAATSATATLTVTQQTREF